MRVSLGRRAPTPEPGLGRVATPKSTGRPREVLPLAAGVIVLAGVAVFANTLHNTFALDDYYRVVENPGIQKFWPPWRHFTDPRTMSTLDRIAGYRPLLPLIFSVNYAISGDGVVGYHLGNLGLHLIASLLLLALGLELLTHWIPPRPAPPRATLIAGTAALVFAVHPVSGIAVNYISARDLQLMQGFFLALLLAYARMRRLGASVARWAAVLGSLALSLLAKPNLVVAPLVFVLFDTVIVGDRLRDRRVWQRAVAAGAVVAAFFAWTRIFLHFSDLGQVMPAGSAWGYGLTQLRLHVVHYLPHFWWPFSIRQLPSVEPARSGFDPGVLIGLGVIAGTIGLACRFRRSQSLAAFCILMYWALMIPESSLVPLHHLALDYRAYPSSGFLYLAVASLLFTRAPAPVAVGLASAMVLYSGAASVAMNRDWRSGERLWTHSVAYGGDAVAHLNLAMSLPDRRDPRVRQHLEEALRLSPSYVLAHVNLCLLQVSLGEGDAGLERCRHAVQLEPSWGQSWYWLASAYRHLGRYAEAAMASHRASELDPLNVEYAYQAALDAQRTGDFAGSLLLADRVRERAGTYKELGFLRGFALQMTGHHEAAIPEYRAFLQEHPDHAQVHFNLAYAYMTLGRCDEAVLHFRRTLQLRPADVEAPIHLQRCER